MTQIKANYILIIHSQYKLSPMKIPTQIDDRFRYGLLFVYLLVIIIGIPISSHYQRKEMAHFINTKLNSRIIDLKGIPKGQFVIKLNHQNDTVEFKLPITPNTRLDSFHIGDSLSKNANSGDVDVFRTDQFGYPIKVSEFYMN